MRSALRGCDDVHEGADIALVAIAPLNGDINIHIPFYFFRLKMALLIKDWDCFLVVTFADKPYYISDRSIALDEVAVFRDSAFMEEGLTLLLFSAIVIYF